MDSLFDRQFHDTKLSVSVEHAFQALAIDETRWPFRPVHWDHNYEKTSERIEEFGFLEIMAALVVVCKTMVYPI